MEGTTRVKYEEMKALFKDILVSRGFAEEKAENTAEIFADNSRDGVYSHGLNRFPRFIDYIAAGYIDPTAEPALEYDLGPFQRWNGNLGVGCTNAAFSMDAAMALAASYGIGCVAIRNTNHWMRGGTYGLRAARAGFAAICWTNTFPNLPSWGAKTPNVGNNPLVMAFPGKKMEILIDGALSQYSYGALENCRMSGKQLPFPGGYDQNGSLTTDPAAILKTWRVLPVGLWKGSGYSLLLDLIGTALSHGNTVPEVGKTGEETGLTQVFIAFDIEKISGGAYAEAMAEKLLEDFKSAEPAVAGEPFYFPGEKMAKTRKENMELGIPVNESIWNQLSALREN